MYNGDSFARQCLLRLLIAVRGKRLAVVCRRVEFDGRECRLAIVAGAKLNKRKSGGPREYLSGVELRQVISTLMELTRLGGRTQELAGDAVLSG